MTTTSISGIACCLAACVALAGCGKKLNPASGEVPQAQVIETTVVHHQQMASQLVLPARIVANPTRTVHIYPLMSGRILSLRILPGQQVLKGEQIGTLQSSDAGQARADFEKAKIEAGRADLQLARAKELLAHGVMAQRDYDDLKALNETDHAEQERARQALHVLGFNETSTSDIVPIVAPISGVVLDVGTGPGELQRSLDNATPIANIANVDSAVIRNGSEVLVFVETAPGKYVRREITLGGTHADNDEVTQGLNDGDKVVTTRAELLREAEGR